MPRRAISGQNPGGRGMSAAVTSASDASAAALPTGSAIPGLTDPRHVWDGRYASLRARNLSPAPDAWLTRWPLAAEQAATGVVLDLGCGCGHDSAWLSERGCRPLSADLSREALRTARAALPGARCVQVDLRDGLPVRPLSCRLILASLVLHYFPWSDTCRMAADLRACFAAGGLLLARVNSVDDVHFGATGNPEVEPGLFVVEGVTKRFFSESDIRRLFGRGWDLLDLRPNAIDRYGATKHVLEVLARRSDGD